MIRKWRRSPPRTRLGLFAWFNYVAFYYVTRVFVFNSPISHLFLEKESI